MEVWVLQQRNKFDCIGVLTRAMGGLRYSPFPIFELLKTKHERGEARTPNQWLKRHNQSLKRAENPFVWRIFRDKMANFYVYCVHKL